MEYILKNHFYSDIDEKDKKGKTALHLVACLKSSKSLELLLKYGADKDARSNKGLSILHYAAVNEDSTMLRYILDNHYYNNIDTTDVLGRTPLHLACLAGKNSESIELLLKYGANKDARSNDGNTMLNFAAVNEDSTMLHYILDHHYYSDINEKKDKGHHPLHLVTIEKKSSDER